MANHTPTTLTLGSGDHSTVDDLSASTVLVHFTDRTCAVVADHTLVHTQRELTDLDDRTTTCDTTYDLILISDTDGRSQQLVLRMRPNSRRREYGWKRGYTQHGVVHQIVVDSARPGSQQLIDIDIE